LLILGLILATAVAATALAARGKPPAHTTGASAMDKRLVDTLTAELTARYGAAEKERIARGLGQVASLWRPEDGDMAAFARANYIADPTKRDATLARLESAFEQLDGHFNEIGRELRRPTDLDLGPLLGVDPLLSAFDASAHVVEDLFKSKVAFVALLNFPQTTLAERLGEGKRWSRRQWAEARLTGRFARRVPAEVQQEMSDAGAKADLYIAEYNVWMHHLIDQKGERLFPKGLRLISHWNLRDELKADYADPRALDKQRMIVKVMDRIVTQTIPHSVIDNPLMDWNPYTNEVKQSPGPEVESPPAGGAFGARPGPDGPHGEEPDTRYERLLAQYRSGRKADPYSPTAPTAIARSFELQREIPEARVKAMLEEILRSPLVPRVASLIERRLGRKLGPQDLWYNGFQSRSRFSESELDEITRKRYPTPQAFAADIPRILEQLGFAKDKARFVASHIVVDPSRGAGHALQSMRRGDDPHLRTRVEKDGMSYKGYNIAVHELGHNVEQVFSLYEVDHTLLAGVPNSAFTEALAFVFQAKDLELLGLAKPDAESERLRALNDFWQTWEIAGVALVDIAVWHWMYDHPQASAAELRQAVVDISKEHWNRYYAPVLGERDALLLGIYSHMISYPLYLPDYPLGHLIAFQIEEHLKSHGPLGAEFERMAKFGQVAPDVWMENATGKPVGAGPLLAATEAALGAR
jgi:hypothetical protein